MKKRMMNRVARVVLGGLVPFVGVCGAAEFSVKPDGNEWQDHTRLNLGTLAPAASFVSFDDVASAKAILPKFCANVISLDSEKDWHFNWCVKPSERPIGFQDPAFDVSKWPIVKVPCSWQAEGIRDTRERFGTPIYSNQKFIFTPNFPANSNCWPKVMGHDLPREYTLRPEDNPVGSYRRDFEVPAAWLKDSVFLRFDGVDSFFYLWVNGTYMGFSKDSRSPATFDITRVLKEGRNVVAVEVYRNCDGSYLEAQDMFRLSGIFRSVSIRRAPKTRIRDVFFVTEPTQKGNYAGDWNVKLQVEIDNQDAAAVYRAVKVHLFDDAGVEVKPMMGEKALAVAVGAGEKQLLKGTYTFSKPALWSAELPNLYTLILEQEEKEVTKEAVAFQLGFREVEIRDAADQRNRTFLFNGQPIKMRGANRHETDPRYGHFTPDEVMEKDVMLLKQMNCNHVRNSHYPQPDYWYYLCNKYGIYVMDEGNVESHGFFYGKESISHVPSWKAAHVSRVMAMVERNKNHPSIVIWSHGNEAGPGENFRACTEAVKARDNSRPVQYERNNWLTDMGSRQYPLVKWVWDCANGKEGMSHEPANKPLRYPFHINEYAHNMGNAMGDLKDYQDAIESTTRICGAAIWDWVDQGLWKTQANGTRILAFGGDFNDFPNDGQFVMNGCILADRTPEPGCAEIAHVFQPFTVRLEGDKAILKCRHYFRGGEDYDCTWHLFENGFETDSGVIDITALKPQKEQDFPLPACVAKARALEGAIVSVRFTFAQKKAEGFWPKGWIIAADQIDFPSCRQLKAPAATTRPNCTETACARVIEAGKYRLTFCKKTGELVSLKAGRLFKTEKLLKPMTLDVFRAPVSNELREGDKWAKEGLRDMRPISAKMSAARFTENACSFETEICYRGAHVEEFTFMRSPHTDILTKGDTTAANTTYFVKTLWTIFGDGTCDCAATFTPSGKKVEVARVGFQFLLDMENADVAWFGKGPFENYNDRISGAFLGRWLTPAKDFFFPYDRNQDCGNREGCFEVSLNTLCDTLTFEAVEKPFAFEVNPYTPTELVAITHPTELPTSHKLFFGLFAATRGLGGNSCGPLPQAKNIIPGGATLNLAFRLR